jgi:hypothetical protein
MEKLSKFAIYLGIGMGVTFFVLFLFAAIPGIIQNSIQQWEQLDSQSKSEEELKAKFQNYAAYLAMYERFPDAKEELTYHGGGNGNMRVGVMNFETNKQLILDMYYNSYEDRVTANVNCIGNNSEGMNTDTLFAEDFIKNTNCLDVTDSNVDSQGTRISQSPVVIID